LAEVYSIQIRFGAPAASCWLKAHVCASDQPGLDWFGSGLVIESTKKRTDDQASACRVPEPQCYEFMVITLVLVGWKSLEIAVNRQESERAGAEPVHLEF